jgi:hypothetical protein
VIHFARGDVALGDFIFRPTYAALVAAEAEIGSLFALLERTGDNRVTLAEMVALLWHCQRDTPPVYRRDVFAEMLCALGLAKITPVYRQLIEAALAGG